MSDDADRVGERGRCVATATAPRVGGGSGAAVRGARPGRAAALVLRRPSVLRTFAKLASGTRAATTAASRATRAALETS